MGGYAHTADVRECCPANLPLPQLLGGCCDLQSRLVAQRVVKDALGACGSLTTTRPEAVLHAQQVELSGLLVLPELIRTV
jgi:hypothetical protein